MAPKLMRAAVCKELGERLVIEQVPVPVPQGREVLVRVEAVSLCHSDISIISGSIAPLSLPLIVGHEAVSIIESLGPDATSFGLKVGDRIGAPLWHGMCLDCVDCKEHGPDFCPTKQVKGLNAPGYFAEYTLVDAASAVVIPKEAMVTASPAALAPLFCAGVTVWDALKRAKLRPTETIAIVGAGGLGQIAARYAQAMGVRVIVLDVQDEQLQRAKANGSADHILNTKGIAPDQLASQVAAVNHGRLADAVVVTSGALPAYGTSWNIVRTEGRVIAVGIPANDLALTMGIFTGRSLQLIGAKVPGQEAARECIEFSIRKNIFPEVNPRKFRLEDINDMISLMKEGMVQDGRMVVQFF